MRVTVTVPDPVGEEAERVAEWEGVSVSALFARAVEEMLERRRRRRAVERIEAVTAACSVDDDALRMLEEEREGAERSVE